MKRMTQWGALGAAAALALTGCASSGPFDEGEAATPPDHADGEMFARLNADSVRYFGTLDNSFEVYGGEATDSADAEVCLVVVQEDGTTSMGCGGASGELRHRVAGCTFALHPEPVAEWSEQEMLNDYVEARCGAE